MEKVTANSCGCIYIYILQYTNRNKNQTLPTSSAICDTKNKKER